MDELGFRQVRWQVRQWVPRLTGTQRAALRTLLDAPATLVQCLQLIALLRPVDRCPHCDAARFYRHGIVSDLQRYRCLACGRTFNALTGTPLAYLRLRQCWLPFLQCMLDTRSVRAAADVTGIHRNTSFRWRHRFLVETGHDRPSLLHGIVEADETYLLESQKGSRHLTRPPRRRGGVASRRGITHEHDCILVARDRRKRTRDFVAGRGPVTTAKLKACLPPVLAPRALLVSDSAAAYFTFARTMGVRHAAINVSAGVITRGVLHIQNVNAYHGRFHQWLAVFRGVASRYLPNYLGWRHALDGQRITTPAHFLAAALGCRTCAPFTLKLPAELPDTG